MSKGKTLSLSFVNNGEKFTIPKMTVCRHEELMDSMLDMEGKEDTVKYNREYNKHLVWKTFQIVDKNVTLEDVKNMHLNDFIYVFQLLWDSGRELEKEDNANFRKS